MVLGMVMFPSNKVFAVGFPTLDIEAVCNAIEAQLNQIQSKLSVIQETMSIDNIKQVLGDKFAALAKLKDVQKIKAKLEEMKTRLEERKKRLEALKKRYEEAKKWVEEKKERVEAVIDKGKDVYNEGKKVYDQGKEIYDTGKAVYEKGQEVYNTSTKIINTALSTDWSNPQSVMQSAAAMQKETVNLGGSLSGMEKGLNTLGGQVSDVDVIGTQKSLASGTKDAFGAVGGVFKKNQDGPSSNKTSAQTDSENQTQSDENGETEKNIKNQAVSNIDKKSDTDPNIKSKVGTDTRMITPSISNSKTPSAFKKTSANTIGSDVFISHYVSMGHAAAIGDSFKTGTDDNGNFYFADGLANWCQINYDDRISEDTFEKCFNQICGELNADVEEDRNEAKKKYESILAETVPSIFNKANSIKNKAGASTVDDDIGDLSNKAGDSTRSKIAIEIENAAIDLDMARDNLQLAIGNLELSILNDKFMSYCEDHKKAESEDSSWEPGGLTGTDDNGLFYFSDELANWCDLDISKGVKAEDVQLCICTICEDINAQEESERQHNLNRYAKVRGETLAGTYVNLIRFKKEVASSEIDDRIEKIKDNANDNEQAQMSGLAEMVAQENRFQQYQNLITDAYAGMTVVFDTIPVYCKAGPVGWEKLSDEDGKTAKERCRKYIRKLK